MHGVRCGCTEQAGAVRVCGDNIQDAEEGCDDDGLLTEACAYGEAACGVRCGLHGTRALCAFVRWHQDAEEGCDDGNILTEECAYGEAACTGALRTAGQAGAVRVCGDGVQDVEEGCDGGNTLTEECAYGEAACTCAADCTEQAGAVRVCGDGVQDVEEGAMTAIRSPKSAPMVRRRARCALQTARSKRALFCLSGRDPACAPALFADAPTVDAIDYTYWYWPVNHRPILRRGEYMRDMHILTGHYGFEFNEANGTLSRLGIFADRQPVAAARHRSNGDILALPQGQIKFEAGPIAEDVHIDGFLSPEGGHDDRAQLRDSGRFMNFVEFPPSHMRTRLKALRVGRYPSSSPHCFSHTANQRQVRVRLSDALLNGLQEQWLAENVHKDG